MAAKVHEIGAEKNRVLVVDDFMDDPRLLIDQAKAMAPFRAEAETYYPGLRRFITLDDRDSDAHVVEAMQALAPLIGQVFGVRTFTPAEATFCLVTKRPDTLTPGQRLPHYDTSDPNFFATLHYLSPDAAVQGGTSFYRHRATGFERIGPDRAEAYDLARQREMAAHGQPPMRYFDGSDDQFERIARFEGRFNRLLIYRGSILHSGDIPEPFAYSADPAVGRLTCNIFFKALS
jgi:hypothetical protein